ncbi:putative vacuole protein [Papiliotrema laurentii]|uniref:Vacuole protein n=1 Tax=Papiliotrema laurentii TaxID=5418 RepID=A0AAD9CWA8_PAPLA|nr:putative vacuole protein [Papiliotrema laurentii]
MCCQADWKREVVPDHKFDFINVREFHNDDFMTRVKYVWKYILILKSFAVYGLDVFTATTYILSSHWTNAIQSKCGDDCAVDVRFSIAKWVFVGCIIFSFLLLGYETYKAKKVIASRDISYAFTNLIANDYYSLKSYDNFCLFCRIDSSTKKTDKMAFFIYFTFKEWKRTILADGPRQSINALTLYSFAYANGFHWSNLPAWWDNSTVTAMLLFAICFTVLMFLGSLILLIVASILYIPFLCYMQGNLKEFVCHKVDKRIAELIQKNRRDRIRRAAALEKKLANGSVKDVPGIIPQPTLPNVSLDDDDLLAGKRKLEAERRGGQGRAKREFVEYDVYPAYPPTVEYAPAPAPRPALRPYDSYEEYGSSTNLAANAAPMGLSYPPVTAPPPVSTGYNPNGHTPQPHVPPRASEPQYAYGGGYGGGYEYPYPQGNVPLRTRSPAPSSMYEGLPYDRPSEVSGGAQGQYGWDHRR